MNADEIKQAIAENYPIRMTYKQGGRIQIKHGRHRRSMRKTVGFSEDHFYSVELVGSPNSLHHIEFMFGLHDPAKAAHALIATVAVIKRTRSNWDEADEEWLKGQVEGRRNGQHGKVATRAMLMPMGERPFTVFFVKVYPG